jgi:hypothetical protein
MSVAFLNTGATSLAAANWSDTTGFVNSAELVINAGGQTINSGLTYALTEGILYLDVLSGFSGTIGGTSGSLAVEGRRASYAEGTQLPRLRYEASGGQMWYTAQSSEADPDNMDFVLVNSGGTLNLTGTFVLRHLRVSRGNVNVAEGVSGDSATYDWYIGGGNVTIDYSATRLFDLDIAGGTTRLGRGVQGALNAMDGQVIIDAAGETFATISLLGATMQVRNCGTITDFFGDSGLLDFSQLQRPLTITNLYDTPTLTVIPSPFLTITNRFRTGNGASGLT